MIIPITLPIPSSSDPSAILPPTLATLGSSELCLIELQGELESHGDVRCQTVGQLNIDEDGKGKPTLRIGHNQLEGKFVNLPKPLAVLHRATPRTSDSATDASAETTDTDTESRRVSYTIRAVVRKKLVFAKRPMPIVGSTSSVNVAALRAGAIAGGKGDTSNLGSGSVGGLEKKHR